MKRTQGRQLVELLKKRPYTTMEMLQTGISTAPWKRLAETLKHDQYYRLESAVGADGLLRYRVVYCGRLSA